MKAGTHKSIRGYAARIKQALDISIAVLQGGPIPYPHPAYRAKLATTLILARQELRKRKVF